MHNHTKDNHCWYCGIQFLGSSNKTKDHIIPKDKGGNNTQLNLRACCRKCNSLKGNKTVVEFAKHLESLIIDVSKYQKMLKKTNMLIAFVEENKDKMVNKRVK